MGPQKPDEPSFGSPLRMASCSRSVKKSSFGIVLSCERPMMSESDTMGISHSRFRIVVTSMPACRLSATAASMMRRSPTSVPTMPFRRFM